ncbi:MAG: amidohydrolase [Woeseiaceae bacterium]
MRRQAGAQRQRYGLLPLFAVAVLGGCAEQQLDSAADLVLENGRFYTVDARRSWAEAVAISDGRFVYVGGGDDVAAFKGSSTRVVDLDGRMVLPGMFDVHIHALASGVERLQCDLSSEGMLAEYGVLPDDLLAEYLARIRRCAAERPNDTWVVGHGWVMDAFGPGALASRELLDAIEPDRPVYLESADGHTAWVNSRALELAGISGSTPDPKGGRIDREPGSLEPLGSLQEHAADLVEKLIPAPDLDTRLAGLRYAVQMLNAYGITSIQDAKTHRNALESYEALDDLGELTLRVVASNVWDTTRGMEQLADIRQDRDRFTRGNLRATSVKIWLDGVMENYTAAMLDPYLVEGASRGMLMMTEDDLDAAVAALDEAGFQVHVHAIGDRATRVSLDAFEKARAANGASDNRHHIAHLQVIQPSDIPRFRELGVAANFTPYWAYADRYITELTLPFIRPELARSLYPIGSLVRDGAVVVSGSDWAVSSANPFLQIETAVSRRDPLNGNDPVFIAEERISLPEAIAMLTIDAAWVNHSEADTGSIEVGKYADLAILDRNLFDIEVEAISETQVVMTLFGGEIVFEAGSP